MKKLFYIDYFRIALVFSGCCYLCGNVLCCLIQPVLSGKYKITQRYFINSVSCWCIFWQTDNDSHFLSPQCHKLSGFSFKTDICWALCEYICAFVHLSNILQNHVGKMLVFKCSTLGIFLCTHKHHFLKFEWSYSSLLWTLNPSE